MRADDGLAEKMKREATRQGRSQQELVDRLLRYYLALPKGTRESIAAVWGPDGEVAS